MKTIIFCLIILLLNFPAWSIDYSDFPADLQPVIDERLAELEPNGGICIAGRVTFSDGAYINGGFDVMVNLNCRVDEPLVIFEGGWFIMNRILPSFYTAGYGRGLVLRAFGYKPIDKDIKLGEREITYIELEMEKTPPEKLSSIAGIVINDQNEPVEGATVMLSFPFSYSGTYGTPMMSRTTGPDGQYSFEGLSSVKMNVTASASGYAYNSVTIAPLEGELQIVDLELFRSLKVVIDYVYQADGSDDFSSDNVERGTIKWTVGSLGADFSERGLVEQYEDELIRDLELRQDGNKLKFDIFYVNERNGYCDMGAVDFDSVEEAPKTDYTTNPMPCVAGHVYVVKTYEGNYAKFIVTSISQAGY
jgi:hypothetical protein